MYFPVFVEGANMSMGDMHFSQGDDEVSFCGAIGLSLPPASLAPPASPPLSLSLLVAHSPADVVARLRTPSLSI